MITWKDLIVENQRREDQRARADRQRNLQALHLQHPVGDGLMRRSLHSFGQRLVAWGCGLQARYPLQAKKACQGSSASLALPAPRRALDK